MGHASRHAAKAPNRCILDTFIAVPYPPRDRVPEWHGWMGGWMDGWPGVNKVCPAEPHILSKNVTWMAAKAFKKSMAITMVEQGGGNFINARLRLYQ